MVRNLFVDNIHPKDTRFMITPPFRRIPRWESMLLKSFFAFGLVAPAWWIMYYLPDYRGGVGPHVSNIRQQRRAAEKATKEASSSA